VTLASGLARLATIPVATASPLIAITIVIVRLLSYARARYSVSDENINIRCNDLFHAAGIKGLGYGLLRSLVVRSRSMAVNRPGFAR
jgi:hypothetical protein